MVNAEKYLVILIILVLFLIILVLFTVQLPLQMSHATCECRFGPAALGARADSRECREPFLNPGVGGEAHFLEHQRSDKCLFSGQESKGLKVKGYVYNGSWAQASRRY